MSPHADYSMYHDFITRYLPQGFLDINRQDPFMTDMEEKLSQGNQFFYIADLLTVKILFTSAGSQHLMGLNPDLVDAYTFFEHAHPEDQQRLNHAQAKLYKLGQSLLIDQHKESFVSLQLRERSGEGNFMDYLLQTYSFYREIPHPTIFTIIVATQLDPSIVDPVYGHYYAGDDASMFRYPDNALLQIGHKFSLRELEIIKMIAAGESSEQIATKLLISVNTVNTHRRNILKKTKKSTTHELIVEMQEYGIL